ncbi:uncharacterized protein LOC124156860 [Ischnura elegans]|uniref:uncharacterized protein LOC124156860 n=1 Tax=Ischnura elegans TaxID=197161 RepID=UPI001ED86F45|nr:uncharacterized protein LOC124156860 [Ischnura elegans]
MRLLFELGCYIFRKKSRVGRATDRQLKLLVDYMSTHSSFAAGKFTGPLGYEKSQGQWQTLANMLNEQGGYKEAEQWKKTWRDLKRNIRAKAARINAACRETGNRPVRETLSEMEEKCLSIFGSEVAVGLPGRDHCDGIPDPSQIAMPCNITADDTSQQSEASRAPGEGTSITVEEHFPAAVDHMEIIVEDLFHKEEPGTAGRQKHEGDLQRTTATILEAIKSSEKMNEDLEIRKINALERVAASQERQAAAAERQAAAAERMAAAAERKAAAAERMAAANEKTA